MRSVSSTWTRRMRIPTLWQPGIGWTFISETNSVRNSPTLEVCAGSSTASVRTWDHVFVAVASVIYTI